MQENPKHWGALERSLGMRVVADPTHFDHCDTVAIVFSFTNIYLWPASTLVSASKTWSRPRPRGSDLVLGLALRVLASVSTLTLTSAFCLV